ncbi:dTDP-4-dehydrorhamnose reductase [Patescibacteria group bacterium]|nr:dTDP-4-dehydrorhamnose reductase [Patescibacteria group bacterium]
MKILITGSQGMLGQDLVNVFLSAGHEVIPATRKDLDITDQISVNTFVDQLKPDVIINAAAYNAVDAIEKDEEFNRAMKINGEAPGYLAQASARVGASFVHFSTDYVFDGNGKQYYAEDDAVNPISRYGVSKFKGEQMALKMGGGVYICRVSKLFGESGVGESAKENFVSIMLRLNKDLPDLKIADEEYGLPTYSLDVAKSVLELIEGEYQPGIYHMVNEGEPVSVYGFAKEIFEMLGIKDNYRPCPRSDFPRPAKCPHYSPLKNTKLPKLRLRNEALKDFLLKDRIKSVC